jgi:hypothetical protein
MDTFGGTIVPFKEVEARIKKDIGGAKGMEDVPLILTIPGYHTQNKNVLLFESDATIGGDFVCDPEQKWIKKNQVSTVVCFGNLTIDGDLLNDNDRYWPVMYIAGTLSVCNILKGGVPLVVRGDLKARGYIIGTFNDGPLRVGGDLNALGYIPLASDKKELRGHVITGAVRTRMFDARAEFSRDEIRSAAIDDVLNYKWFDIDKVFEMGRKGESIWRTEENAFVPTPVEPAPPIPKLKPVDLTTLGKLHSASELQKKMEEMIFAKIPNEEYPKSFSEYVGYQLADYPDSNVLVLDKDTHVDGDIELDWSADWARKNNIRAIACMGDLSVSGTIRNRTLEGGPMLFVGGNLRAANLLKSGATVIVLGDVTADGIVIGEYNDGVMRIYGNLTAQFYMLLDHDGDVRGEVRAHELNDDDGEYRDTLVDSVFLGEDESWPDVDLVWAHLSAGREILRED